MRPTKLRSRLEHILGQPWALHPQTLSRLIEWARHAAQTNEAEPPDLVAQAGTHDGVARAGSVAIIPVYGVIEQHSDWFMEMFGGTSIDGLRESLRAALGDPDVKAIVLDIDSPGGTVAGVTELAAEIRDARGGAKPIVASANAFCASAAYWIASQCDEVAATPSAQVGSIGVYAVHEDVSQMLDEMGVKVTLVSYGEHKVDGNMYEPLSDEARADIQERVDATGKVFVADVAAGRRVSSAQVESDFGAGRVFNAKKAQSAGMVDRVETLGATVQRLASAGGRRKVTGVAASTPSPEPQAYVALLDPDAFVVVDPVGSDDQPPFADRLAALAAEADAIVEHATERARLRAKEGRPAFSTSTERSLRSIRGAIDELLEPDDPAAGDGEPAPDPVEPAPAPPPAPPTAAPPPLRFQSRDAWLSFLETHQ